MSWRVEIARRTVDRLRGLEPAQRDEILNRLDDELAADPTSVSRPAAANEYGPAQVFAFWLVTQPETHARVFFRYGADETTLFVEAIGVVRYRQRPEW